jgi:hypothetical protein
MKKKAPKKLTLARETVRDLTGERLLKQVMGGTCLTCLPGTCGCDTIRAEA